MYVQPGSLQNAVQMGFDVAGLGGSLDFCRLIKMSPFFSSYLFCNLLLEKLNLHFDTDA